MDVVYLIAVLAIGLWFERPQFDHIVFSERSLHYFPEQLVVTALPRFNNH